MGAHYVVLGIQLWEQTLDVLIADDLGRPCLAPAALFELRAQPLPSGWMFGLCDGIRANSRAELWTQPRVAVWGYPELVCDSGHAQALIGLEDEALRVFSERLREGMEEPS